MPGVKLQLFDKAQESFQPFCELLANCGSVIPATVPVVNPDRR